MSYVAQSGLDSLLEALRQSGMNTDGVGSGTGASDSASSGPQTPGSGSGAGAGASGSRGGVGGFPFGGFGGFGGAGNGGGRGHGGSGSGDGGDGGHGGPTVDFEFLANDFHLPSKKWLALIIVLALLVIAGAYWWFHPAINIHSTDFWGFVFIVILLPLFLVFWMRSKQYKTGTKEVTKNEGKAKTFRILSFVPVAVVALVAIGALMSMAIFPGNAEKYSNVLKTDTLEFAQDIKEVNYSEIPVIDRDSAILLGNREMGSIPEYVSQFEVSNLYSPDQLPGHAGAREPLGLRRPVQVVHQPRGRHPGLRAREHDHPGRRDRASGRHRRSTTRSPSRSCATSTATCSFPTPSTCSARSPSKSTRTATPGGSVP